MGDAAELVSVDERRTDAARSRPATLESPGPNAQAAPATETGRLGVLFIHTPTLPPLGADTWVQLRIAERLDRASHDVHVACATGPASRPTPAYEAARRISDIRVVPVSFGPELSRGSWLRMARDAVAGLGAVVSLMRLSMYVKRHGIRVIHTTDRPRDALASVLLSKLTATPCVIHCHVAYGEWMRPMLKWSLRHADALIGVSNFVADSLIGAGHKPDRVHAVHNAIETERWVPGVGRSEARSRLGIGADDLLVLTVCRLFPEKGPAELIRACASLRPEHPELRLVIVGNDVTRDAWFSAELRRLVAELGVEDIVTFLGHQPDVAPLFAAADVFAMPSHGEPFGLVFLEAMAMKLPVVGVADGGTLEVVTHGHNGLLAPYGDIDALAAALGLLLDDSEVRAAMGECGWRTAVEDFRTERMADQVAAVYERVGTNNERQWSSRVEQRGARAMSNAVLESVATGPEPEATDPRDIDGCRRRLDDDGYVVFRSVVSPDRLRELGAAIAGEFARLKANGELFEGGGSLTGHLNCFPGEQSRFVYDEIERAGIIDLVRAVRPDIVDRVRATMNFNLPGSVAQHYHSDGLYTEEFLICNVAVVDTDLVNGAIDMLPGTHREFYKFWRYAIERKYRLTTRVPLRCGDVILRKSTVWHRGMPNYSSDPRPMMAITFGEDGAPDGDPFTLNEGKPYFFPNWYSTSRFGRLRERVYVTAPLTYSAYRFVRSLYGNKGYSSW